MTADSTESYIELIPGAAQKGFLYQITEYHGRTVQDIITAAVNSEPRNREHGSLQAVVRNEFTNTARVTIAGKPAALTDKLDVYEDRFTVEQAPQSKREYRLLKIGLAKPQEGGHAHYS